MIRTGIKSTNCYIEQFCIVVIPLVMFLLKTVLPKVLDADRILRQHKVIPDVIDVAPKFIMDISYRNCVYLEIGSKVDPADMQWLPRVSWPTQPGILYTLLMIDPDVPVRKNPTMAQRQHWIVGNIPGWNYRRGETITGYMGPVSPRYSGLHRTTFLVYSQQSRINFTEPRYSPQDRLGWQRHKFSSRNFAEKYNLTIFAATYFRTGWPLYNVTKKSEPSRRNFYNPFRDHFAPSPKPMEPL